MTQISRTTLWWRMKEYQIEPIIPDEADVSEETALKLCVSF
jgi:plasmid maintenance system antidote protein VapI